MKQEEEERKKMEEDESRLINPHIGPRPPPSTFGTPKVVITRGHMPTTMEYAKMMISMLLWYLSRTTTASIYKRELLEEV